MQPNNPLVQEGNLVQEGERLLRLCNACRYCEGFCAVFPAMERRSAFSETDVNYLANLCHNCGECYYACPYTPPHEYALNLPKTLAEIRVQSYKNYAKGNVFVACVVFLAALAAMVYAFSPSGADFYQVIPHLSMVLTTGAVFLITAVLLLWAYWRFWRDAGARPATFGAWIEALGDAFRLTNLNGHGAGCPYPQESLSHARRWFHHATFYGFLLCFASTCVAAFYHFVLDWRAPYPYLSVPVVLGTLGGVGLLVGPAGLYWLKQRRDPALDDLNPRTFGDRFLFLLLLTSVTGLLLLALRETRAMSWLLIVHLGVVLALFASLPFGKFVHGKYRFAALLRNAIERRTIEKQNPS